MAKQHMGIDQYGNTYHSLGRFPRKELLRRLCRSNAKKMYTDITSGGYRHIGWVIGGLWIRVFRVEPLTSEMLGV
jgi:hypothetical protein